MPVSSHAQPLHPAPGRRTVVRGLAWSVPTVTLATAAPAFAVSPGCLVHVDVVWNDLRYTRESDTRGIFITEDPDGPGPLQPLRLTVANTFLGTNTQTGPQDTYSDPNLNLVPETGWVGGHQNPLEIHQSPIYDQYKTGTRTPQNKSETTFTFDRPVTDLSFTITDIDSEQNDFYDAVAVTSSAAFTTTKADSSFLYGDGTTGNPWRPWNAYSPIPSSSTQGNASVQFTQDVTSFTIHYWNQSGTTADYVDSDQSIFLSNLKLTYNACP